jgi:hypothetical protein
MISNRRVEELANEVRRGNVRIDLDQVSVRSPQGVTEAVSWPYYVTIDKGRFVCHWRVPQGSTTASGIEIMKLLTNRPTTGQVSEQKDNFHLSAVTDKGVPIEIKDLEPFPSVTTHSDGPTKYSTGCHSINLPAAGLETWDSEQLRAHLEALNPSLQGSSVTPETIEMLFAIIPGVKLLLPSSGTEIKIKHPLLGETTNSSSNCHTGEIHGGNFCVEAKGDDLWVYYQRFLSAEISTPPATNTVFNGILAAIGFTHGCHPWPYYWQHMRDHIVVNRWIRCCPDCVRDPLLPIEKKRMLGSSDANDLFKKACFFFSTESDESALTTRALWLMRECNRESMPFEIRLVSLCSILDGIIHRLGDKLLMKNEPGKIKNEQRSDERRRKWNLVVERLHLPWEAVFEPAWRSWELYRHPLAHGFNEIPEASPTILFDAYSRITGAIYILMAKSMGYTGEIASSVLEGKRISIGASPAPDKAGSRKGSCCE